MAFVKKTWVDRDVPYPDRREIHHENGAIETVDIKRAEGTPRAAGTQLNAANFNNLEDRISGGFNDVNSTVNALSAAVQNKQDVLTAGTGISIANNVISISLIDADAQEY